MYLTLAIIIIVLKADHQQFQLCVDNTATKINIHVINVTLQTLTILSEAGYSRCSERAVYIQMLPIQNRGRHVHTYVANT